MLDETDIRFLLLIIRGYNNSYAIYRQLKKEAEEKFILTATDPKEPEEKHVRSMTYKNANRRILLLVQIGVIEEIKHIERVPHGRIDYKLTMKGLEYIIPHFLSHPQEMRILSEYMSKAGLDKYRVGQLLMEGYIYATEALNEFHKYTNALYYPFGITKVEEIEEWFGKYGDISDKGVKGLSPRSVAALSQMTKDLIAVDNKVREDRKLLISLQGKMLKNMRSAKLDGNKLTDQFNAEKTNKEEQREKVVETTSAKKKKPS